MTGLSEADLDVLLPRLETAGLIRADANPLEPADPYWTMEHRLARFHYAMVAPHLSRWQRGYITDKLWRMTHARWDRYVCRPEFQRLAREWALGDPAAAATTRITVPDPRFRQLRTLELAAWNEQGEPVALGTVRWKLRWSNASSNASAMSKGSSATRRCASTASPPASRTPSPPTPTRTSSPSAPRNCCGAPRPRRETTRLETTRNQRPKVTYAPFPGW